MAEKWPSLISGGTPRKVSSHTMNEGFFFVAPPSPATASMTASQFQQWLLPTQQFLIPPVTKTSERPGKLLIEKVIYELG